MDTIKYNFTIDNTDHGLEMVFVEGTHGKPYLFGTQNEKQEINIKDFFIGKFPVTNALWKFIMGRDKFHMNPEDDNKPARFVSWDDITCKNGFLEKINSGTVLKEIKKQLPGNTIFRLPSETEWEYAARGGKNWKDNFQYSGSNNIDEVAWYQLNSYDEVKVLGQKAPNQLGIYEMNGNVWEWCQDYYQLHTTKIPKDGSPLITEGPDRVLRGGCHHNWAIHCTVSKRYEIGKEFKDNCIGFRLVLSKC